MNLAIVYSRTNDGIDAPAVIVEVHLGNGLPGFSIVGLPEMAVRESKDRVRAAIINSRFEFPARRITVNLAPADIPKDGGRFDLPIALGILAASGQISEQSLADYEFIGELSLSGKLRPVKGVLPTAYAAYKAGRCLFLSKENADEAKLIKELTVYAAHHLSQITAHLTQIETLQSHSTELATKAATAQSSYPLDLSDVKGQFQAKRALEVAAAGGHNMLMVGPPGTGKTMLASRLTTLLPPMTDEEALESATIASISDQGFDAVNWGLRPMREPHHTASGVALVGGGSKVRPGEISLAHNGILFLDELTEFDRKVLEVLREPLETGRITISRAARQASYPAQFQLIAAMNFCPQGHSYENCNCSSEQQRRYRSKLSAPFLDRIDLQIEVPSLSREDLQKPADGENSEKVRSRVVKARNYQLARQQKTNRFLSNKEIEKYCKLNNSDEELLAQVLEKFRLSARAYHRILKVARTIADLAGSEQIQTSHISEAVSYRSMDRLIAGQL